MKSLFTHITGKNNREFFPGKKSNGINIAIASLSLIIGLSVPLIFSSRSVAEIPADNTTLSDKYLSATIYVLDSQSLELVPRQVQVEADRPAASAVKQILQAYHGQDIGIKDCEVTINPVTKEAIINFKISNPQGTTAFHGLSSKNQLVLFEGIRETLLNQPMFKIKNISFSANGVSLDDM